MKSLCSNTLHDYIITHMSNIYQSSRIHNSNRKFVRYEDIELVNKIICILQILFVKNNFRLKIINYYSIVYTNSEIVTNVLIEINFSTGNSVNLLSFNMQRVLDIYFETSKGSYHFKYPKTLEGFMDSLIHLSKIMNAECVTV